MSQGSFLDFGHRQDRKLITDWAKEVRHKNRKPILQAIRAFRRGGLADTVRSLAESLGRGKVAERQAAAWAIGELASRSRSYNAGAVAMELNDAITPLVATLSHQSPGVQHAAFAALGCLASLDPATVARAVVNRLRSQPRADEVIRAVELLRQCGEDAASVGVEACKELLKHEKMGVRQEACRTLGWLWRDAGTIAVELACVMLHDASPAVQLEAAQSLLRIEGGTRVLAATAENDSDREQVLGLLRQLGPNGRDARFYLQTTWFSTTEEPSAARHSPDFRSVNWNGAKYSFSANQAACVRVLWESWEAGTPDVGGATILEAAGCAGDRIDHVFRGHLAWNVMIIPGATKGSYRLRGTAIT